MMPNGDGLRLILLELNEVNMDLVREYARRGRLPAFGRLMDKFGLQETEPGEPLTEQELQPWIQWVSVHTGLPYSSHRVFNQGDIVNHDHPQIWEELESGRGLRVGAVSPMNAVNRTRNSPFFMPDPWTRTEVSGPRFLKRLARAYSQVVGDNAAGKVSAGSVLSLLECLIRKVPLAALPEILGYGFRGVKRRHYRAMFLDRLLSEVFLGCCRRFAPDFASLFLNGVAHIQHHSIDESALLREGPAREDLSEDVMLRAYASYDILVDRTLRMFPKARLMIATAISGVPRGDRLPEYYFRLRRPEDLLKRLGLSFEKVIPRMSTTFTIRCASEAEARRCFEVLKSGRTAAGKPVLSVWEEAARHVEICGAEMTEPFPEDAEARFGEVRVERFADWVTYVGRRKGDHSAKGYVIDTDGAAPSSSPIPLSDIRRRILDAFGPGHESAEPADRDRAKAALPPVG